MSLLRKSPIKETVFPIKDSPRSEYGCCLLLRAEQRWKGTLKITNEWDLHTTRHPWKTPGQKKKMIYENDPWKRPVYIPDCWEDSPRTDYGHCLLLRAEADRNPLKNKIKTETYIQHTNERNLYKIHERDLHKRPRKETRDRDWYAVATISRLLKIIGLFCKRALQKRRYSAKETHNFKEPTNRSHPITVTCTTHPWKKPTQNSFMGSFVSLFVVYRSLLSLWSDNKDRWLITN